MTDLEISVQGRNIHCRITVDKNLVSPVFCFSLMVTPCVISGGTLQRTVGGWAEVALPDLVADRTHEIIVAYADAQYKPVNRAWLPLGPYLRHDGGILRLPSGLAGAAPWVPPRNTKPAELALCPPPSSWVPDGGSAIINTVHCDHFQLQSVDALARRNGLGAFVSDAGTPVVIAHDPNIAPEAYELQIFPQRIAIKAGSDAGVFYAGISLLSLINGHRGRVPTGHIDDAPRFEWRGQHLDCARHYYEPDTILRYLDLMALMKMNRFHWHFADDEAFRLELDCRPENWRKTSTRGEGHALPGVFGGGPEAGGSYSKTFAQRLIAHAEQLHIEVMPEIEVPGHSLCLTTIMPELRDGDDTGTEVCVQGYVNNTMNPAKSEVWTLLTDIVTEIAQIFPFRYMHLGCDELAPGAWEGSPLIDQLKTREGLETRDDVQGWMMERLAKIATGLGKTPAAWEEAARGKNGGIGHNTLLFSWSGQGPGLEAARAGYDVVMTPAQHVYLDMAGTGDPDDWGAAWAAFVSLDETLNWDPVPDSLGDSAPRIKGVQGAFWSEFTTSDAQIWPMLWPRLMGVATSAWSHADIRKATNLASLAVCYDWANPGLRQ